MPLKTIAVAAFTAVAAAALLAACSGTPAASSPESTGTTSSLAAQYRELAATGEVFKLDPAASHVRIFVFRSGLAARAGHNHVLSAPDFQGYVYLPSAGLKDARFDLAFRLDRLAVDDPLLRGAAGPAFATPVDDNARSGTRNHMLGPDNLDAASFPDVLVHGLALAGEWPQLVATVAMSLHGVSRPLLVPLQARQDGTRLTVNGGFAIRQSDFGAKPYSALGGLLAVQDEVAIQFELSGTPAVFDRP
jgi:hypothetical protein